MPRRRRSKLSVENRHAEPPLQRRSERLDHDGADPEMHAADAALETQKQIADVHEARLSKSQWMTEGSGLASAPFPSGRTFNARQNRVEDVIIDHDPERGSDMLSDAPGIWRTRLMEPG